MARTETMEARVLAWMETTDGNWITAQEAAQQIPGIDWKQARGALDRLRKRRLVQRLRAQAGWLPMYRLRPRTIDGDVCRVGVDMCDWLPLQPYDRKGSYCRLYRRRLLTGTRGALRCQECLDEGLIPMKEVSR